MEFFSTDYKVRAARSEQAYFCHDAECTYVMMRGIDGGVTYTFLKSLLSGSGSYSVAGPGIHL